MNEDQLLIALNTDEPKLSDNTVAAAVVVEAGEPSHAALVIRYNGESRIFHFFGSILLESTKEAVDEGRLIFVKELNFIPPFLISSFVAHCELIEKEATPKYGFFYNPKSFL